MKKLILSTTFLIAGTFSVLAQGKFDMSNAPWEAWPDAIDRLVYVDRVGGTPVTDPTWTCAAFELQGADWVKLGDSVNFFGPGDVAGVFASDGVQRVVSTPPASGVSTLRLRVYNGEGALLGSSPDFLFTQTVSVPPAGGDTLLVNLRAFAVPEPSTIALGVLGLGAMLLFRRRK